MAIHFGRPRIRGNRLASLGFAAMVASGVFVSQAAPTSAASIGQFTQARVQCNYRYHQMTLTPSASPAPGYASQIVSYQYSVLDLTVNRWVAGFGPSGWGTIAAWTTTKNAFGMTVINQGTTLGSPSYVNLLAGHHYAVRTDYWWPIGGVWYTSGAVWSRQFEESGFAFDPGNGYIRYDFCIA